MRKLLLAAAVLVAGMAPAAADEDGDRFHHAQELFAHGDYAGARAIFEALYEVEPTPELLFDLGQVEFNLGEYQRAIDYYQRFLDNGPDATRAAYAQQAIGAARARLTAPRPPEPEPKPPAPPRVVWTRHWDQADWVMTGAGGLAVVAGGALFARAHVLGDDTGGTLSAYDRREASATLDRKIALVATTIGVGAIVAAVVRWRYYPKAERIEPTASGVAIRW